MKLIVAISCLFFIVTQNVNTQEISEDITTVLSSTNDNPNSPPVSDNTPSVQSTTNSQRSFESLLAQKILEHASKNDWTGKIHLTVANTDPSSTPDKTNLLKSKATPVIDQQFVDQFTKIFSRQYRKQGRSNNKQRQSPFSPSIEQIRINNEKPDTRGYNYPLFNQQQLPQTQQYYYPTVNEQQLPKPQENYYYQPIDLPKSQQMYYYYPIINQGSESKQFYYNYPTSDQTVPSQHQFQYYFYPTGNQVDGVAKQLYYNYPTIDQTPKTQQLYYNPQQSNTEQLYYYYPQQSVAQQLYYYPQQQISQQLYYYPQLAEQKLYNYVPQTSSQQLYSNLNQQSYAPNDLSSKPMYYYIMPESQQLNRINDKMSMSYPVQNTNMDQFYFPTKKVDFVNSDTNKLFDESTMMEQMNQMNNFEGNQEQQQLDQQTYINMQKPNQQQPQTSASNQLYYYYLV